jgi:formylglycine-generating enzyme
MKLRGLAVAFFLTLTLTLASRVWSATDVEMVLIKGGCFQMGDNFEDGFPDEKPVHEVCVDDFYLGKYKVTQGQWQAVMGNNPAYFKNGDNYPVENISWNNAQEFIQKLNQQAGKRYRLPTEAEWEYAARGGGNGEKWAGTSNESELGDFAWYFANSGSKTHSVGEKRPNSLGLYDMSGNVWEWCQDIYNAHAYKQHSQNNPIYEGSEANRVLRGGSWGDKSRGVRAPCRGDNAPDFRRYDIGLRLAEPK